jgi:hypothetical protein
MCGACGCVLHTPISIAQWHAGLTGRVGDVSEGRGLTCLSPLVKTHARFPSFSLGVDEYDFNRQVCGVGWGVDGTVYRGHTLTDA